MRYRTAAPAPARAGSGHNPMGHRPGAASGALALALQEGVHMVLRLARLEGLAELGNAVVDGRVRAGQVQLQVQWMPPIC